MKPILTTNGSAITPITAPTAGEIFRKADYYALEVAEEINRWKRGELTWEQALMQMVLNFEEKYVQTKKRLNSLEASLSLEGPAEPQNDLQIPDRLENGLEDVVKTVMSLFKTRAKELFDQIEKKRDELK